MYIYAQLFRFLCIRSIVYDRFCSKSERTKGKYRLKDSQPNKIEINVLETII